MTDLPYPRFLGVDDSGDFVWLLADGRWTWGSDPYDAACRRRTFEPERFTEKYGAPVALQNLPTRLRDLRPESVTPIPEEAAQPVPVDRGGSLGAPGRRGAHRALAAMERAAKGWADGAAENEEAMGRRDRKPSDEQPFVLEDILNMIDDAAREVGLTPVYSERSKRP
jgi:hypothetical protein